MPLRQHEERYRAFDRDEDRPGPVAPRLPAGEAVVRSLPVTASLQETIDTDPQPLTRPVSTHPHNDTIARSSCDRERTSTSTPARPVALADEDTHRAVSYTHLRAHE